MDNIFDYTNYKDFLNNLLKATTSPRGLQGQMARHIGCQSAYLYQVLKNKGEFTEDQAYKITTFLKFNDAEQDFFMTLVRYSKASGTEFKNFLLKELSLKIKNQMELKNKVGANAPQNNDAFWNYYFSSINPSLIHITTSSSLYQTPKKIAEKLKIPEQDVLFHLKKLNENKLVDHKDNLWVFNTASIHFDKDSKFNLLMQLNRRIYTLYFLNQNKDANTHFSSLFTIDKKSATELTNMIHEFVKKSHELIHAAGSDEPYLINIDFINL